ncbi:hypothetical protein ZWY2020_017845 [Hordeum vulgare]|nr:hypothetical protein ZWY2020_017845 [Hordeum vulgare]
MRVGGTLAASPFGPSPSAPPRRHRDARAKPVGSARRGPSFFAGTRGADSSGGGVGRPWGAAAGSRGGQVAGFLGLEHGGAAAVLPSREVARGRPLLDPAGSSAGVGRRWLAQVGRARRLRRLELVGRRGKGSGRAWSLLRSWAAARGGRAWSLPVSWRLRDGSTDLPAAAAGFSGVGSSACRLF